jgi:hypothetical protein
MPTHDYVIDNQTAPNFRADLNQALQAIVSTNSSTSAPATTYANMMWYDTTNNLLRMRNEADDAWITLGTLNQVANTFAANVAIATQVEAEAGSNDTKVMTPLKVEQHMLVNDIGWGQSWQGFTGERLVGTSYQNTTGRPILVSISTGVQSGIAVSPDNSAWNEIGGVGVSASDSGFQFIVPNTWYYRQSFGTKRNWSELR